MSKLSFCGFTKDFSNCKRAILSASFNKGSTSLECHNTYISFRIIPKVDLVINVAHDSEQRVLRFNNGIYSWNHILLIIFSAFDANYLVYWLYNLLGCLYQQRLISLVFGWPCFECFWVVNNPLLQKLYSELNVQFYYALTEKNWYISLILVCCIGFL